MRLKVLLAVTAIVGLVAVGALGFVPRQTFAQGPTPTPQAQTTEAPGCDTEANDTGGVAATGTVTGTVSPACAAESKTPGVAEPAEVPGVNEPADTKTPGVAEPAETKPAGPDTDNVQDGAGAQVEDGQPDTPAAAGAPASPVSPSPTPIPPAH